MQILLHRRCPDISVSVYLCVFRFVSDKMGGAKDDEQMAKSDTEVTSFMAQLKTELTSNVIPIGKIRMGIHYHRALLFKVVL